MADRPLEPRIYVASLSDYSAGRLHGRWILAGYGADEIREEIQEMLAASSVPPAAEWAIHASDGFDGLHIDEHADLEAVADAAELLDEYGAKAAQVIAYYGGLGDLDEARETLEGRYAGSAESLEDWAEEYATDRGLVAKVPDELAPHLNFESYGRTFEANGDIFTVWVDGDLHIFWTR